MDFKSRMVYEDSRQITSFIVFLFLLYNGCKSYKISIYKETFVE